MAGRIPPEFIDGLLERIDIVDLVSRRLPLKRAGKEFQACCPFHDEKTPSFTVSREKQFYHCFGCGAHGTAVGFLMEYDNLGFVEAVQELADLAGLEVPREAGSGRTGPDPRPLFEAMERVAAWYQSQLRTHPASASAVGYLKSRGLSGAVAKRYGIGFAPPGWDNLIRRFGAAPQGLELLTRGGLLSEPHGKRYDRFRSRIMFPIRNVRGKVVGFGGRVIGDEKPKYLNSPETELFHKGRELYGLFECHQALNQIDRLIVVEGYMDVVALAQFGIDFAVGTLGTATTPEHLERLFRSTSEVVFCFDGDRAGREAGWKALSTALPAMRDGREIRFLFLPEGEDPDTLVRKEGAEAFRNRIASATPLSTFLFDRLQSQTDMDSLDGRARLSELAKPFLAKLRPGVFREMMQGRLAELVGIDAGRMGLNTGAGRRSPRGRRPAEGGGRGARATLNPVRMAIALLLKEPAVGAAPDLPRAWQAMERPGVGLLRELLELTQEQPNLSAARLVERWRESEVFPHLETLWRISAELPTPIDGVEAEFRGALARLDDQYFEQETETLLQRARAGTASDADKQRLSALLKRRAPR